MRKRTQLWLTANCSCGTRTENNFLEEGQRHSPGAGKCRFQDGNGRQGRSGGDPEGTPGAPRHVPAPGVRETKSRGGGEKKERWEGEGRGEATAPLDAGRPRGPRPPPGRTSCCRRRLPAPARCRRGWRRSRAPARTRSPHPSSAPTPSSAVPRAPAAPREEPDGEEPLGPGASAGRRRLGGRRGAGGSERGRGRRGAGAGRRNACGARERPRSAPGGTFARGATRARGRPQHPAAARPPRGAGDPAAAASSPFPSFPDRTPLGAAVRAPTQLSGASRRILRRGGSSCSAGTRGPPRGAKGRPWGAPARRSRLPPPARRAAAHANMAASSAHPPPRAAAAGARPARYRGRRLAGLQRKGQSEGSGER